MTRRSGLYDPGEEESRIRARSASECIPAGSNHALAGASGSYGKKIMHSLARRARISILMTLTNLGP